MVSWDVTIGGTTIDAIFEVNYDNGETDKIGKASIVCANNTNNRSVESGDDVIIKKNSEIDYTGYVSGKPTEAGAKGVELEIEAIDKRSELKYQQASRVFYQKDTGEIIRDAINYKLKPTSISNQGRGYYIHEGDSLTNWSSDIPKFSLGKIANVSLAKTGGEFIFCGWPQGSGSDKTEYEATFDDVPSRIIPGDGQLDSFFTRILINNSGEQFDLEIDLRDNAGNNYIWQPELQGSRFQTIELKAEDATTEATIGNEVFTNGTLEYRFKLAGTLPEGRGAAIDFASGIPYRLQNRATDIQPTEVEDTGNVITRRIDRSIFEMIREFATEDGYVSYVDNNDILHYEQGGQTFSNFEIDFDSTPVVNAEFNRDYQQIINRVIIQGDDDIRRTFEDSASINFYGISAREEPIVDEQIQTYDEASRRARGFLEKHAWDDSAFTFEIADADYQSLQTGDEIIVNWPPENISGSYVVTKVETDYHGIVTVNLTSSTTG